MRKFFTLFLATFSVALQIVSAQNCPANPTYLNQGNTVKLTSGVSLVENNGGQFNVTVEESFSSSSSICVLNGSTLALSFHNANSLQKGGTIYVDKNSKLTLTGENVNNFPLIIINEGTVSQTTGFTLADGASIVNSGTYSITGSLTFNSGVVSVSNSGTLTFSNTSYNTGSFTLTNAAEGIINYNTDVTYSHIAVNNKGTINYKGNVVLQGNTTVNNSGYMYLTGNDVALNDCSVDNNGVMVANGEVMLNGGATLTNKCTIKPNRNFSSNGSISNTGNLLCPLNTSYLFKNQGTFVNGTNGFVQGSNFDNEKSITGGGNFYFTGNTKNQGDFHGTNGNTINFYDASNSKDNFFDEQNHVPGNITKNPVSPNTSTIFTSCADAASPLITKQPQTQSFCTTDSATATFSVSAASNNTPSFQWMKNGANISGATGSSLTIKNLTLYDTIDTYSVAVTNTAGTTVSTAVKIQYIIVSQPLPLTQYLATGNSANFTIQTSGATSVTWQKDGVNISGGDLTGYSIPVVNQTDSGTYKAVVNHNGGVCTSDAAVLKTSVVLYSKSTGNVNQTSSWGVEENGTGSTPVDFTREEHTFVITNRSDAETGTNLSIAGTLDISDSKLILTPGTTLAAGRIIRSKTSGVIIADSTANLTVHGISSSLYNGASDLYFDADHHTIKNLTTAGSNVTLHNALNITSGKKPGVLQVNSGTFFTSDLLTLKSDSLGTASIANSTGDIAGKVTIEKWVHARRAWRLMGAPVTSVDAPTINTAWQEGATSSGDNPHPGYGTHITYGAESDGFDRNPQKSFSMKVLNSGSWIGVPATNKTHVTDYTAYMFFVRGNRSYDIAKTTVNMAPSATVLRVTGYVNQHAMPAKTIGASGFTLAKNPYASPVDFANVVTASTNVKKRIRVWDPTMAGTYGVGAWVTVDKSGSNYRTTPPSTAVSNILQAGQGFMAESADGINSGSLFIDENAKDQTASTVSSDRMGDDETIDTTLEMNLRVFNEDGTTGIADGILYYFNAHSNDSVDVDDARKLFNFNENLTAREGSSYLTIDNRTVPAEGDTMQLYLGSTSTKPYQFEFVPSGLQNKSLALWDKYTSTATPISSTDTTRITIDINTGITASKATDRFTIIIQKTKAVLPVTFTKIEAYVKDKAVQVDWNVQNEQNIAYYEVEKSTDGASFSTAGTVSANGAAKYSFTDANPANGTSYYRIKSVDISGSIHYTSIATVRMQTANNSSVSVYPNPLTGPTFTITLSAMTAGTYKLAVVNQSGAVLFNKTVTHPGGTASQKVTLNSSLAAGIYYIRITAADGAVNIIKIAAN